MKSSAHMYVIWTRCDTFESSETLTYVWFVLSLVYLVTGLHMLDWSTLPRNRSSPSVWTLEDRRSNPNCWLHKIQQMLCLFSFLWLLHFFADDSHWPSPSILPSVAVAPYKLRALMTRLLTLTRVGSEKWSRPWELPKMTGTTGLRSAECGKLQRL